MEYNANFGCTLQCIGYYALDVQHTTHTLQFIEYNAYMHSTSFIVNNAQKSMHHVHPISHCIVFNALNKIQLMAYETVYIIRRDCTKV